jgi:hypothetical protein
MQDGILMNAESDSCSMQVFQIQINALPFNPVALHLKYCYFTPIHQALPVGPAMEARISDHVWSLEEIIRLLN